MLEMVKTDVYMMMTDEGYKEDHHHHHAAGKKNGLLGPNQGCKEVNEQQPGSKKCEDGDSEKK